MKTSELTGAALDWAVAKIEGATDEWRSNGPFWWGQVPAIRIDGHDLQYRPSTDWAQGGPIIEREKIQCTRVSTGEGAWQCFYWSGQLPIGDSDTLLIAAMRCYVASKLGDEVEIPKELL